jgi:acyl carrier protein
MSTLLRMGMKRGANRRLHYYSRIRQTKAMFFNALRYDADRFVMQTAEIYQKLTGIFRSVFDDDAIVVRPELTAGEVDEWDSLSHIRLVLSVEQAFGVKFSAAEVGKLKNVGEFVDLIQRKTA